MITHYFKSMCDTYGDDVNIYDTNCTISEFFDDHIPELQNILNRKTTNNEQQNKENQVTAYSDFF